MISKEDYNDDLVDIENGDILILKNLIYRHINNIILIWN